MRKFKYSIAYYDRRNGQTDYYGHMPMDGVDAGNPLPEFLRQAGENGWQLCGSWNTYLRDGIKSISFNRELTDPDEVLELIFIREA